MLKTAHSILKYSRAKEAEKSMLSIKEILNLIQDKIKGLS